jgi:valyl-tRNA synthetase
MPTKNTNKKSDKISSKKTGTFQSKFGVGVYDPKSVEDGIYKRWEESGYFNPDNLENTNGVYCNVLPPPNSNGELHVGHASGYTVMDIFGRYNRMNGKKTLLLPGKDHAGIQTQVVFEKILENERGTSRSELGRKKFYKESYDFCIDRANYMRSQEKKIGLSADWSREKFTLDPDVLKIALETFVRMEKDGLVYKGKRIINWCPRCATALADVELLHKETQGKLYYIKYPIENSVEFITVATTRPETMLGDSAVAVNPDDERYKLFVGKNVILPLQNRVIPIIQDKRVDKTFGTGAVKITPTHDPLDWQIGKDHNLAEIQVIDEKATITNLGGVYAGLPVSEAREQIIKDLEKLNLLAKTDDVNHSVTICERCKTVIEPLTSDQWFVNVDAEKFSLKKRAIEAIEKGEIKIFPENFKKILISWFENLHDWCISRQIWWGPQFPVWYCKNCGEEKYIVSLEKPKICPHCKGTDLVQDENTFDTWFTSGQWVHTTLKSHGNDFDTFYPSDMMVTGRDLLFFWASRMIMMSLYATDKVPFKNLFFTGLVRDKDGHKFSKSRGNGIDPLLMIDRFGADALRMSLIMDSAPGQDSRLSEEKIETFRNFTNKLWNISRYCLSQENFKLEENITKKDVKTIADEWIVQRIDETNQEINNLFEAKQISLAADTLKAFTWNEFADWYIEINKLEKNQKILGYVFDKVLRLWHPFMPFITEYIWTLAGKKELLMISKWPQYKKYSHINVSSKGPEKFKLIQEIVINIRDASLAGTNNKPKKEVTIDIANHKQYKDVEMKKLLKDQEPIIKKLRTGVETLKIVSNGKILDEAMHRVVRDINIYVAPATGKFTGGTFQIDDATSQASMDSVILEKSKEKAKKIKEIADVEKYLSGLNERLENKEFMGKASKDFISKIEKSKRHNDAKLVELKKHLASLK